MGQDYSEMVIMLFKNVFLILSSYMLYQIFLDMFSLLSEVNCCVQNGKEWVMEIEQVILGHHRLYCLYWKISVFRHFYAMGRYLNSMERCFADTL